MSDTSIHVVGVGGQGVITAAMMIGTAADLAGLSVRVGQLHGMSQRGGSVESTILMGPGKSPFLPARGADIMVALEPLELHRALGKLHSGSRVLVSSSPIMPTSLAMRGRPYPDVAGIFTTVAERVQELVVFDGRQCAADAGSPSAVNMVALGILAERGWLPVPEGVLAAAIATHSSDRHLPTNRRVFDTGRRAQTS